MTDHQRADWEREIYKQCDEEDAAEMDKDILGYDPDKVSKRPWKADGRDIWSEFGRTDGTPQYLASMGCNATKECENCDVNVQHIVRCVNEHGRLQARSDMLDEVVGALQEEMDFASLLSYQCIIRNITSNEIEELREESPERYETFTKARKLTEPEEPK